MKTPRFDRQPREPLSETARFHRNSLIVLGSAAALGLALSCSPNSADLPDRHTVECTTTLGELGLPNLEALATELGAENPKDRMDTARDLASQSDINNSNDVNSTQPISLTLKQCETAETNGFSVTELSE